MTELRHLPNNGWGPPTEKEFCLTGMGYPSKIDAKPDLQSSRDAQKTYDT